jgi:hypothetical protein
MTIAWDAVQPKNQASLSRLDLDSARALRTDRDRFD